MIGLLALELLTMTMLDPQEVLNMNCIVMRMNWPLFCLSKALNTNHVMTHLR